MSLTRNPIGLALFLLMNLLAFQGHAQSTADLGQTRQELEQLKQEYDQMKSAYEERLRKLDERLKQLENAAPQSPQVVAAAYTPSTRAATSAACSTASSTLLAARPVGTLWVPRRMGGSYGLDGS